MKIDLEVLTAGDLMSRKLVCTERHDRLLDAIRLMRDHGIHCLLIMPESASRGIGILTGKDCIQILAEAGTAAIQSLCVEDVMTLPAVTVPAGLCISDCMQLMRLSGVRSAPVIDGDELVGMLSFTDVLHAIAEESGGVA